MLWQACEGEKHITALSGKLFRLVENQEQVATLNYVDTLDEQALLEEMLEETKPSYPVAAEKLHYLLKTPFRYPPLLWGSRFGAVHEPSIFYGGCSLQVTLAESAYYRFVFWDSINAAPIKKQLRSEHSLFKVNYKTPQGVALQSPPFNDYQTSISTKHGYSGTQQLGASMRTAGVEAFTYLSARDKQQGLCVGLFSPVALTQKKPSDISAWFCELTAQEAHFKQRDNSTVFSFKKLDFWVDGAVPLPAT